jgi:two-component system nitrate/nitrite sensor histidine kinase NarX
MKYMLRQAIKFVPRESKLSDDHNALILAERERIANLLHDDLAQDLAFINSQAAAIRKLLTKGESSRAMEQIKLLEEVAQQLSGDIRVLIKDLNQPLCIFEGLKAALGELTEDFSYRHQIPVRYEVSRPYGGGHLSYQTRFEIYYIVQEALVNIHKHADANIVWVQLLESDACVDVIVRDDGRGFRIKNVERDSQNHFGLSIMQARAGRIGAQLEIERLAECGTQLTLCIPYKSER